MNQGKHRKKGKVRHNWHVEGKVMEILRERETAKMSWRQEQREALMGSERGCYTESEQDASVYVICMVCYMVARVLWLAATVDGYSGLLNDFQHVMFLLWFYV